MNHLSRGEFKGKSVAFLLCLLYLIQRGFKTEEMLYILVALLTSLVLTYWHQSTLLKIVCIVVTGLVIFWQSEYVFFLPFILVDYLKAQQPWRQYFLAVVATFLVIALFPNQVDVIVSFLLLNGLIFWLQGQVVRFKTILGAYKQLETESHQREFDLTMENKYLIKEQNLNLALGIESERNRIARDIHDNVGHLLSSALIQIGALKVINRAENLTQPLAQLEETVGEGMTRIRESVHDLHDDSLDFEKSLNHLVESFTLCPLKLTLELESRLSPSLKVDFLMIIRESLGNIMKHAKPTQVMLEIKELPGFYRLQVRNNGVIRQESSFEKGGIGIQNMKARIKEQNGRLTAENNQAVFTILAIVPKGGEADAHYYR